jgi:hypothetical protein
MAWTQDDVEFFKSNLLGVVPHFNVDRSDLGGAERASIMFLLCFEKRETWLYNIMENSRYMRIMVDYNGKVEHFSGSCGVKMRGFTSTDRAKILGKILAHILKVKELMASLPAKV